MIVTAHDFIGLWKNFLQKKLDEGWADKWKRDNSWTEYIIGNKRSSNCNSPLGNHIVEFFPASLNYRTEDGSIDLSVYEEKPLMQFFRLENGSIVPFTSEFYPSNYVIFLEHENKIHDAWREIAKLTYFQAPLKILITYHSKDNITEVKRSLETKMLEESFKSVLSKNASNWPENKSTEYLLIIGGKFENELHWEYLLFNSTGNRTNT